MKSSTFGFLATFALILSSGTSVAGEGRDGRGEGRGKEAMEQQGVEEAPRPHHHPRRGERKTPEARTSQATSSYDKAALLVYQGGTVLHGTKVKAIFWGPEWTSATFAGDKIKGIDSLLGGLGGSSYANTTTEYYDRAGYVTSSISYLGHVIDQSAAPVTPPDVYGVIAEGCKITQNRPDKNALYVVYTSTAAGNVNYCAWHTWGTCTGGAPIQVAYMPNLDSTTACHIDDSTTGHSVGLSAVANVTAHELMETITDPRWLGWRDSSGSENGDKCSWVFAPVLSTLSNGSQWKLQMEWSNAAFKAGNGLPNLSGQKGCVY